MSLVNYRPLESPVAQMSAVAGLVASTAQSLSLSFQEKSVLLRICQSFGSSVMYDVYRSVDGVVDSEPMVSGVSDAFYLSVVLGQENSILVLSLRADGYYPILLTVSYLYEKDLLFISQVGAIGEMKYKTFNSTELSQNLDYTIDSFTAVPDLSIDTLPKVIDFLSGFVTTDNLKQYIADQVDVFEIVQGPGSSTTAVMSQNAVTEELRKKASLESVTASISAHNTSTTAHADIRELLNTCVGLPAYDSSSYKITFTTLAGATAEIDLPIEQLALRYNAETDSIEFDNADGTTTSIPVSAFVKEYVGSIGDRIQVSIDENNVIHATILKNSIDWGCLSFELQERINDHVTSADFATKAVRTDIAQTLSAAQQEQALANLGMKVYVTDSSILGSTLSAEEIEEIVASKVLLLTDTGDLFSFGSEDSNRISFYQFTNNYYVGCVTIRKDTYYVSSKINYPYRDTEALHFTVQNPALTSAQQEQAWLNLGIDLVVLKFPEGATSVTLTDEYDTKLRSGAAVLVTVDGTNTGSGIYNADNHIFTSIDFNATSRPLYYSLALFSGLFYCSYDKESKTFAYYGIIQLIDSGALRFDRLTSLSGAQQSQAFENLGWKVHVISESAIGSSDVVSDDEKEARLAATTLLVQETGLLYNFSISSGGSRRFYGQFSNSFCTALNVNEATGVITSSFAYLYDPSAVSFDRNQSSVSDDNKNKALGNIGIDLVRLPYSLLGTTLSDEMANVIDNARGIILVDTPNAFILPTIYNKGRTTSTNAKFIAIGEVKDVYYISYNKNTKALAAIVHDYTDNGCVRYVQEQSLTDTQKDTVLSNIGLGFVIVDYSELSTTLSDDRLSQLVNAKGFILTNTPDNYTCSVVFTAGTRLVNSITFSSIEDFQDINYIVLNIPNKVLSLVQTSKLVISNFNQNLTNTEKDTVLSNIGLDFVHVDYSLLGTTLTDEMFVVIDNAKGIILVDISSDYRNPIVFIKGNNGSESCLFVSHGSGTLYCTISLNKSLKFLSRVYTGLTYEGSVRYTEEQSLTTAQQEQALDNIGFPLVHLDFALIGTTLDDNIYNAVASAKGIILENVPDGNNAPSLYLVGNSDTVTTIFVSEFNARVWFVLTLSHTSKKLSLISTGYATDVVRYSEGQNLTDTQKQQARTNIGVKSANELLEDADFIAQLKTKLGIA